MGFLRSWNHPINATIANTMPIILHIPLIASLNKELVYASFLKGTELMLSKNYNPLIYSQDI